jgi:hypothetical protein
MTQRRIFLPVLLAAIVVVMCAGSAKAWHTNIVECYFYVLEQCGPDDQDCLDFGFDDCDGSYDTSIVEVAFKQATLRNRETLTLDAGQSRGAARLQGALKARKTVPGRKATAPVYRWATEASRKLLDAAQLQRLETRTRQQAEAKRLCSQGQALVKQVLATRGNIGFDQAQAFEVKMEGIVGGLDRLAWGGSSGSGIAGCMQDCGNAFPGTGGGNGWNRFVCKAACLVHGGDNG